MYSSTDTEKQVEVLQAENTRLRQEVTDTRNAQTKAATVSKLNSHRQQVSFIVMVLACHVLVT